MVEQPPHLDEILERAVAACVGDRLRLQRLADANEIEQQLLGDGARVVRARQHEHFFASGHVDARPVANLDEAHRLELLQRFANRRMADAEPARHLHDRRQAIALLVVALLNHRSNTLRELVGQALLQDRGERISHEAVSNVGTTHALRSVMKLTIVICCPRAPGARRSSQLRTPVSADPADRTVTDSSYGRASASC